MIVLAVVTAIACAAGAIASAHRATSAVARVSGLDGVLSGQQASIENFLLVGSDSRAGADPSSPDAGAIGTEQDVGDTARSDTIMVLRRDRDSGSLALLSLPRDLYVQIPGRDGKTRINAAYNDGPATLVRTIQEEFGIPIEHYIEIDFFGFKRLIDAMGGVEICFDGPTRDTNTGLSVAGAGCFVLDGVQALAYARSRHYEEFRDGAWHEDPRSDLGRVARQQDFVNRALQTALHRVETNPFEAGDVVRAISAALRVDDGLDIIDTASTLRDAVGAGLATYTPPVVGKTIGGNAVLVLGNGAEPLFDYFRGTGPAPAAG
jgi:LCP family protein required for cell wall assembly